MHRPCPSPPLGFLSHEEVSSSATLTTKDHIRESTTPDTQPVHWRAKELPPHLSKIMTSICNSIPETPKMTNLKNNYRQLWEQKDSVSNPRKTARKPLYQFKVEHQHVSKAEPAGFRDYVFLSQTRKSLLWKYQSKMRLGILDASERNLSEGFKCISINQLLKIFFQAFLPLKRALFNKTSVKNKKLYYKSKVMHTLKRKMTSLDMLIISWTPLSNSSPLNINHNIVLVCFQIFISHWLCSLFPVTSKRYNRDSQLHSNKLILH